MTNAELKELVHLLIMCGIMDKTALESGNVTNEEWLRMKSLIEKYQAERTEPEVQGDIRWTDKVFVKSNGDIIDFEGRVVGHINLEDMKGGAE